jgi:hypothetical protein
LVSDIVAQSNKLFKRLQAKAQSLSRKSEDQVISTVYADTKVHRKITTGIVTMGEFVVPGSNTLRKYPRAGAFPFHFRKTFTPGSGPIQRGETPQSEFAKTTLIHQKMLDKVPEPLGFDVWTYRCEAICGQTLFASSPFRDLDYDAALALEPDPGQLAQHADGVLDVCELLDELHALGWLHEDLTTHNAMLYLAGKRFRPILIDLAGSVPLSEVPQDEQASRCHADYSELYRELVLAQLFIGPLKNAHAQKSIQAIDELFTPNIVLKLARLKSNISDMI